MLEIKCGERLTSLITEKMLDKKGKITSLELKNEMRDMGFFISQYEVSDFLRTYAKDRMLNSEIKCTDDTGVTYIEWSEG